MSDMITTVAKAICVASGEPWGTASANYRDICQELARAAIEAMHEPTDAMAEFAEENFDRDSDDIKVCYRAFIHAALSQDTPSLPLVNCTCHDEASKRLCLKKNECTVIEAHSNSLPLKPQEAVKPAGTPPSAPAGTNSDEAQP